MKAYTTGSNSNYFSVIFLGYDYDKKVFKQRAIFSSRFQNLGEYTFYFIKEIGFAEYLKTVTFNNLFKVGIKKFFKD